MHKNNINETIDNQQASNLSDKVIEASTTSKTASLVECKICHKRMRDLTSHLNKVHHVTCQYYLEIYPGSQIMTEELRLKRKQLYTNAVMSGKNSETCSKGGKKTAAQRKENNTASEFGRYIHSFVNSNDPIRCKRISDSHKELLKDPDKLKQIQIRMRKNHWMNSKVFYDKIKGLTPEEIHLFLNKQAFGKYTLKSFEYKGHKYKMRSSYERRLAMYLIDNNIDFLYEPFKLRLGKFNYLPDFVINKHVLEVKSLYWLNKDPNKNIKRELCTVKNGFSYTLITETELNNPNILKSIIGKLH